MGESWSVFPRACVQKGKGEDKRENRQMSETISDSGSARITKQAGMGN